MFETKSKQIKRDEELDFWFASADDFTFEPQEFYETVQKNLEAIKVPGLECSQVEYAEGGGLSANRIYLRLIRERLAFDICAAPFGTRYFFTCRTLYSPARLTLSHIIVVLIYLGAIYRGLYSLLGPIYAGVALGAIILTIGIMFRSVVAKGLGDVDAAILKIPGLGPVYEQFFRKDTYYRRDTRSMYLDTVPAVVKAVADEITASKGAKLIRQYQSAPILGELYKPLPPREVETVK